VSFPKPSRCRGEVRVPGGFSWSRLSVFPPTLASIAWISRVDSGLLLRGWAAGHLEKNTTLADGGLAWYAIRCISHVNTALDW